MAKGKQDKSSGRYFFILAVLFLATTYLLLSNASNRAQAQADGKTNDLMLSMPDSQELAPADDAKVYLPRLLGPAPGPVHFTHGVASGEVTSDSAVLWTRTDRAEDLVLEVGKDRDFTQLLLSRNVATSETKDNTAKTMISGLMPGQTYYYRWRFRSDFSPTGQFKTSPLASADVRFAFSGDSDGTLVEGKPAYNQFEVLDAAHAEDLDFFIYLGDTIYSDSSHRTTGPAVTLNDYWQAYKDNREYDALRGLVKDMSMYTVWDDHEVYNDYAGQTVNPDRYANGRRAFLDYMPVRDSVAVADPGCAGPPLFKVFHWGADVDLIILDERSCRSANVSSQCTASGQSIPDLAPTLPSLLRNFFGLPAQPPAGCLAALNNAGRTMLGPTQKRLFKEALQSSTATYKLVINEVPIQQLYALPYDRWEGYGAERSEILNFIRNNNIENVIFLTTDSHANASNEVYIDYATDNTAIAHEFIAGPIATGTFEETTIALLGTDALAVVNALFDAIEVNCRHLNRYGYGLVDYDHDSGKLEVSLKDETGTVISDQKNPSLKCSKIFAP